MQYKISPSNKKLLVRKNKFEKGTSVPFSYGYENRSVSNKYIMDFHTLIEAASMVTAYHGGDNPKPHDGMYFSSNANFSKEYGEVYQYKLNLGMMFDSLDENEVEPLLPIYDPYTETDIESMSDYMDRSSDTWEIIEQYLSSIEGMGYDSVRIFEGGIENYYVFDKQNIKMVGEIS